MPTAELQPRRLFHELEHDHPQQTSRTAHSLSPVPTINASRRSRGGKSPKSSKRRRIRGAFLWFLLVVLGCCSVGLFLKTIGDQQQHKEALMFFTSIPPTRPLHFSKSGNSNSNQHPSSSYSFISSKDTRYELAVPPLLPPTVITSSSATRKNSTTDNDDDDAAAAASVDHAWLHHKLPANDLATLRNDCATLRYRRRPNPNSTAATNNNNVTRIGLEFLEFVDGFTSLHHNNFHFYHWLEFVVVAFIQLQQVDLLHDVVVVWIHVPHFTTSQFCGVATETTATRGSTDITTLNLNCLLARMVLDHSSSSQQKSTSADAGTNANNNQNSTATVLQFYGLEANNYETAISHPKLRATPETPSRLSQWLPSFFTKDETHHQQEVVDAAEQERRHAAMMHDVDAVLTIQRPGCVALQNQHKKMWMHPMDHFDADQWHARIADFQRQLLLSPLRETSSPILRIGYIDRQNTGRRLPAAFHKLLLAHLQQLAEQHDRVEFLHLHMERLSPMEQIRTAASLHILVGMHGNGLTHQFWMKPRSVVLELFWDSPFQLDYATSAQMMQHDYLCLYNGLPVDAQRVANRDASLKEELAAQQTFVAGDDRERIATGTRVAARFLEEAVTRWLESNS